MDMLTPCPQTECDLPHKSQKLPISPPHNTTAIGTIRAFSSSFRAASTYRCS